VLDVTSQNDTGIGGDLFAIVWVAKEQKLYALNAAGRAPAGWTPEFFTGKLGVKRVPGNGVNAATVPGAVAGYDAMLKRFEPWGSETLERRRRSRTRVGAGRAAARRHPRRAQRPARIRLEADSSTARMHRRSTGDPQPEPKALRLIQVPKDATLYKGAIAEAIVQKVQSNGGVMTREDLAKYEPEWVEPVTTNYHGYDIYQLPPPGQGFAALEMLNILEVCVPKLGSISLRSARPMYALMVEAKKLAYRFWPPTATSSPPSREGPAVEVARGDAVRTINRVRQTRVSGGTEGGTIT
jgi:gamma-glutamyltranspeptidase/glutathione hydrolase